MTMIIPIRASHLNQERTKLLGTAITTIARTNKAHVVEVPTIQEGPEWRAQIVAAEA